MESVLIALFVLSGIVTFFLIYLSIFKNSEVKNEYYVYYNVFLLLFIMGSVMEIFSQNETFLRASICVQYSGFPVIPATLFLFIRKYMDKPIKNNKIIGLLYFVPVITYVLVLTDGIFHLYFSEINLSSNGIIKYGDVKGTVFYFIFYVYMYAIYVATVVFAIKVFIKGNLLIKRKLLFFAIVSIISLFIGVLYLFGISPYGLDISPIFMAIISSYIGYNIYVKNIFLTSQYTRDYALEKMKDGYILVDEKGNYLDANNKALNIFPTLRKNKKNENIFKIIDNKELRILENKEIDFTEITLENEAGEIIDYKITISTDLDRIGAKIYTWLITDITSYKALRTNLEYMAKFDSLSKIYNKSTFFEIAGEKFAKKNINSAVIMMDIDFFKSINDKYGHICGDQVITEIAERFKKVLRNNDLLARFGGEEFVVFLEDVTITSLELICEKLNNSIREKEFIFEENKFKVTVSIGGVLYEEDLYKNLSDMLEVADKRLYTAKNSGRDKFVINN